MAKQFITEAQRMQKLANIVTEGLKKEEIISILKKYEDPNSPFYKSNFSDYLIDINSYEYEGMSQSDMNSKEDVIEDYKEWKKYGAEDSDISEMALPEMARTAGTGGAYTITEKGEEILKQAKATGKAPEGIKNSEIAALVFLFKAKKEGKRVQKMDYAKEKGVDQPAVNSTFNGLEMKELATKEGYTSKQQEPKTSRPRTDISAALSDLDIEESKKTLSEAKSLFADFRAESDDNSIESRFARTISETLHLLEYFYGESAVEGLTIDTLFDEEEMSNIQNGDDFYAGPTESLRFFQTLPNEFTVTNNMDGDKESFKITKTGKDSFNAEKI